MTTVRAFGAPRSYIQGPGVLDRLGDIVAGLGARPVVVADSAALERLEDRLRSALRASGEPVLMLPFQGFVTRAAVDALIARIPAADVVVAVGGGRALDAGKSVSVTLGARLVIVPTIASSDAATSKSAVIHDADDDFAAIDRMAFNPDVVLVDTEVIAAAPAEYLRWGIGDALSKRFEARACQAASGLNAHGARAPIAAVALADACYATLRRSAPGAIAAVERGVADDHLEDTVEAALLLSGLGFESGGLSIAHTVALALAAHPSTRAAAHGQQVAYGLLVQLALDPAEAALLADIHGFLGEVGLPRRLAELGSSGGEAEIGILAGLAAEGLWVGNYPAVVDRAALMAALATVEQLPV